MGDAHSRPVALKCTGLRTVHSCAISPLERLWALHSSFKVFCCTVIYFLEVTSFQFLPIPLFS